MTRVRQGDRLPVLDVTLTGPDDEPVAIPAGTLATFRLAAVGGGPVLVTAPALVADQTATPGRVTYPWAPGDTEQPPGEYAGEIVLLFPDVPLDLAAAVQVTTGAPVNAVLPATGPVEGALTLNLYPALTPEAFEAVTAADNVFLEDGALVLRLSAQVAAGLSPGSYEVLADAAVVATGPVIVDGAAPETAGRTETFPTDGYLPVTITPRVGALVDAAVVTAGQVAALFGVDLAAVPGGEQRVTAVIEAATAQITGYLHRDLPPRTYTEDTWPTAGGYPVSNPDAYATVAAVPLGDGRYRVTYRAGVHDAHALALARSYVLAALASEPNLFPRPVTAISVEGQSITWAAGSGRAGQAVGVPNVGQAGAVPTLTDFARWRRIPVFTRSARAFAPPPAPEYMWGDPWSSDLEVHRP